MPLSLLVVVLVSLICSMSAQTMAIATPQCSSGISPNAADVVFLVDASSAVTSGNFSTEITGLEALGTSWFDGAPSLRLAAVEFAALPCSDKGLCFFFITSAQAFSSGLSLFRSLGGSTNMGAALQYANDAYVPIVRPGVELIVVLITGGVSADSTIGAMVNLLRAGASIFIVGVNVNANDLSNATLSTQQIISVPSFASLQDEAVIANLFQQLLCPGMLFSIFLILHFFLFLVLLLFLFLFFFFSLSPP